ncbi:hypothetical protein PIB30_000986, partial [Stylosanthes scabra]|nr:hypothetical protein [Stylosanthes scabra]
MAVPAQTNAADQPSLWDAVLRHTHLAQERNSDPNLWATELAAMLRSSSVILPSVELAHQLVSHFFWKNHCPTAWKFLERAISLNIVPPLLLLALLSATVVPSRQLHPVAYRLYMELLKRNAFMLASHINSPNYEKIMTSIDEALLLSQVYNRKDCEPGIVLVEFVFSIVWQLLEASLDDEDLLDHALENNPRWLRRSDDMNIDSSDCFSGKKTQQNRMLVSNSSVLRSSAHITPEALSLLMENIHEGISHETKTTSKANIFMASGSQICFSGQYFGDSCSLQWLPIDLILEDALDGANISAFSAVRIVTGLVKVLHAVNGSTWHNAFLGLWIAALRLVQR